MGHEMKVNRPWFMGWSLSIAKDESGTGDARSFASLLHYLSNDWRLAMGMALAMGLDLTFKVPVRARDAWAPKRMTAEEICTAPGH